MEIAISIILALGIAGYQMWSQKKIDKFTKDALLSINSHADLSKSILTKLQNEYYRLFMKVFDDEKETYWRFKWRFESWDILGLNIKVNEKSYENIKIKILGTTNDFKDVNSRKAYDYYICEVIESNGAEIFTEGTRVSCFYFNSKKYISKFVGSFVEPDEKFSFTLATLGKTQTGSSKDILASEVGFLPRAKDYKINTVK